jgi:hypothetical protein
MMIDNVAALDPSQLDPLQYIESVNGQCSLTQCHEHYLALKPALFRLQDESPVVFNLALQGIARRLKINAQTVRNDLAAMAPPQVPQRQEPFEMLEGMGQTQRLRFPQDFADGKFWFGILAERGKPGVLTRLLLNSDRKLMPLEDLPEDLWVLDRGCDQCRLSKDAILQFLSGDTGPDTAILTDLQAFFARFAVFRDHRVFRLLAAWTLGTYCYRLFQAFPYLALRSPDKRCGKSRVLSLLSLLTFNASPRVVYPTEAQLFRGPSRNGGTLLLDEVEALGRANQDLYTGLLAVLNSGFEQGGSVLRLEKDRAGNFVEVCFETYCPRALAGINRLADTLDDRVILLFMHRKLADERTERFSPSRLEPEAQALRDRCYLWALTHAQELHEVYEAADRVFTAMDGLDDRARDLWEPLVSIAALIDRESEDASLPCTTDLIGLAKDLALTREGAADNSTTVQVVKALQEIVKDQRVGSSQSALQDIILSPTELVRLVREQLGWERLSPKGLATLLNPLGLISRSTRQEEKIIRAYHLKAQDLTDLCERYLPTESTEGSKL